jgi:hypothetical protein
VVVDRKAAAVAFDGRLCIAVLLPLPLSSGPSVSKPQRLTRTVQETLPRRRGCLAAEDGTAFPNVPGQNAFGSCASSESVQFHSVRLGRSRRKPYLQVEDTATGPVLPRTIKRGSKIDSRVSCRTPSSRSIAARTAH